MNTDKTSISKGTRGRPKTLDCDETVDLAMQEYWMDDKNGISLNEICRRTKVSKPGIYREFGNEDGLLEAVLLKYEKDITSNLFDILMLDISFKEILDKLVIYITSSSEDEKSHKGCLLVKLRDSKINMGPKTQNQILLMKNNLLDAYATCIEKAKKNNQFKADISTDLAATYLDYQIGNGASLVMQGEDEKKVKALLTLSFSIFI